MEVSINTSINLFRNNIAQAINVSQLPVGVLYFVLKDVVKDIESAYNETLQKESKELKEQIEKEEKEDVKEHQE